MRIVDLKARYNELLDLAITPMAEGEYRKLLCQITLVEREIRAELRKVDPQAWFAAQLDAGGARG